MVAAGATKDVSRDSDMDRRRRESQRVEDRTHYVHSMEELDAFLTEAGDKLVFLSVESTEECDLSDFPNPSDVQRTVSDNLMSPCLKVKSTLARVARECDDALFLGLEVSEDPALEKMAADLGVTRFPTYQYYKNHELVWEHAGAGQLTISSIGEGMLFYGGQAAGGAHASEYITEVTNASELGDFLELCAAPQSTPLGVEMEVPCEKQLAILDISTNKDSAACIHIYPAVLALAKNTAGACRWARLVGDSGSGAKALMEELGVDNVPAFVFFNGQQEVGRYVGSDRLALMNKVIEIQKAEGIRMPDRKPRRRIPVAEAKRIAQAARAKNKADQWTM